MMARGASVARPVMASMGPRLRSRGMDVDLTKGRKRYMLQWGRGSGAAE